MNTKELLKLAKQNGWEEAKGEGKGSHTIVIKNGKRYPIPHNTGDFGRGILHTMMKALGLK